MLDRRIFLKGASSLPLAHLMAAPVTGYAQTKDEYPTKTITVALPYAAGNVSDTTLRVYALELGKKLSQSMVVENMPGGGGVRAVNRVIAAKPDGYTLLKTGIGSVITQALFKTPPYDILKGCAPISILDRTDILVLVRADSKVNNLEDLLKLASSKGAGFMAGISLIGTSQHLCAELFKAQAKLSSTTVPFGSAANNLNSLIGGETDVAFEFGPSAIPLIKGGKLRALAICGGDRSAFSPEIPTLLEKGFADFRITAWGMLLAPAKTPEQIVRRLNEGIQDIQRDPQVAKALNEVGVEPVGGSIDDARALLRSDLKRATEIGRIAKITLA